MGVNEKTGLQFVDEDEASPELALAYGEIKRAMHVPFVPNIYKALAASPGAFQVYVATSRAMFEHITLPEAIVSIVMYAVARSNDCVYCSAGHEASCRMMGIDESVLRDVAHNLQNVSPERVRAIVEFALLIAHDPKGVTFDDFERLRTFGVSDAEIVELILIAGLGHMGDTLADSLKVEVDVPDNEMLVQ